MEEIYLVGRFSRGIEPIQLKGKEYQPNLAKTLNWVEKSTLTAIKGLSAIAKKENIDFMDLVANSISITMIVLIKW